MVEDAATCVDVPTRPRPRARPVRADQADLEEMTGVMVGAEQRENAQMEVGRAPRGGDGNAPLAPRSLPVLRGQQATHERHNNDPC